MANVSGGDRLAGVLNGMADRLSNASSVEVGFPAGSTEPDGTSTPMVAAIQEFGAPRRGIPPRPFFRNMIADHAKEWPPLVVALIKQTDYDAAKTLGLVGEVIETELKQSIADTFDPPLSPLTLMLRGMRSQKQFSGMAFGELIKIAKARVAAGDTNFSPSTKPLVDTGAMLANITSVVK